MTLMIARRGRGDPCFRLARTEAWRATRTPEGPGTEQILVEDRTVAVRAWGPGAEWLVENVPDLLGEHDDRDSFQPSPGPLRDLHQRLAGLRIIRTQAVVEAMVPSILEQKVNGLDARRAYRELVRSLGEPAPGPLPLMLPPEPRRLAELPYTAFHPFGVEQRRAETVRRAARHSRALEAASAMEPLAARRRLGALPGIGPWTVSEVARVALGDPDAVSVGDFHLPHLVSWALAGEPRGTDARMLELLEPYRGQRGRVIRLLELAGPWPPRFGPRMAIHSIRGI
jgi:3-methyladenine DNA glycosylase/8-oxoguanine DNA glycosylase